MRTSARAVIIEKGKLLTMFRRVRKEGKVKEYFVIPGGGQEEGETLEENVKRELLEEMGVEIKVLGYLGKEADTNGEAHYFHCEITKGVPHLGGEELDRMSEDNYYEPMFVSLSELDNINIYGAEFAKKADNKQYINY